MKLVTGKYTQETYQVMEDKNGYLVYKGRDFVVAIVDFDTTLRYIREYDKALFYNRHSEGKAS